MDAEEKKRQSNIWLTLCRDWLLLVFLALVGFVWEQALMLVTTHELAESGFLSLPFCPIYGFTIFCFFYLFGTPHRGRYALKRIKSAFWRYVVYAAIAFLLPSFIEFGVGVFFKEVFDVRLWDYSSHLLNIGGYVSLPISLGWTVALSLFMRFLFLPMRRFFQATPTKAAVVITIISASLMLADFTYNIILLLVE